MNFKIVSLTGLFWILTQISMASSLDSLRVDTIDGKQYIVHRVESKETLFSISKRYNIKIVAIMDANPGTENGIAIFQELLIPMVVAQPEKQSAPEQEHSILHAVQQGETLYSISRKFNVSVDSLKAMNGLTSNDLTLGNNLIVGYQKSQEQEQPVITEKPQKIEVAEHSHVVASSETLYSLSKKYGIGVDEIKALNDLNSNSLEIGQVLVLKKVAEAVKTEDLTKASNEVPEKEAPIVATVFVTTDNSRFKEKKETIGNLEKTTEEGFATKIDGTGSTKKYLALHRFVSIGTIIEVKNRMNNRSIFARVVGKLPETGMNKNVLIRVSKAAFEKLGALDAKIPVEIGYVLD